jgi:hypothetical protein
MSRGLDVAVLAAGSSSLDLTSRRLLPLAAGALLILLVFQQLRRVEPAGEGRYSWSRRLTAGTVGIGFPILLVGLGAVIFSVQYPLLLRHPHAPAGFGSNASSTQSSTQAPRSTPAPARQGPTLLAPDPRAVTLELHDLPAAYHVLKANPVVFTSGEESSPSWDVVFEPDSSNTKPEYALAESLAIVYPSVAVAKGAIEALGTAERANHFQQYVSLAKLADQNVVWVERTSNRQDLVVVRVTWRYSNVVGQVSILASASNPKPERALQLASTQQERLKARAPAVHALPNPRSTPV